MATKRCRVHRPSPTTRHAYWPPYDLYEDDGPDPEPIVDEVSVIERDGKQIRVHGECITELVVIGDQLLFCPECKTSIVNASS